MPPMWSMCACVNSTVRQSTTSSGQRPMSKATFQRGSQWQVSSPPTERAHSSRPLIESRSISGPSYEGACEGTGASVRGRKEELPPARPSPEGASRTKRVDERLEAIARDVARAAAGGLDRLEVEQLPGRGGRCIDHQRR